MTTLATRLGFVEPMKAILVDEPPDGDQWLHEIKHDGYRTQIVIDRNDIRAFTSTGLNWTDKYKDLTEAARGLDCQRAIIDGEAIVQGAGGLSDFQALRREMARAKPRGIILIAFDLLFFEGEDLRRKALEARRAALQDLLGTSDPASPLQFSEDVVGGGSAFFKAAERMGLEGIVSKKLGSHYRSGTARNWQKTKCMTQSEFVVIGTSRGDRAPVALLARETEDRRLEYAGPAWVTLPEAERELFWRANERLKTERPALHMDNRPQTSWLKPEMRVIVKHLAGEEMLRHATVRSISNLPDAPKLAPRVAPAAKPTKEPGYQAESGSVPEREALLAYYREIAPLILPHLKSRPLNLFRCHGRYCFFQRNRTHPPTEEVFDDPIRKVAVLQKNGRTEDYLYLEDEAGIIACVEADAVEFHAWGSRVPQFERPDRIAFDLDPGEGVGFDAVKEAALQLRRSLEAIRLQSWPLLTGGKGVHVVLPFKAEQEWPQVRQFAKSFCEALAAADPDRFTISLPKAKRQGRIFLDYLRNQRTATAIMPYSLRARPGSPVAAPVDWDELQTLSSPARFRAGDAEGLLRRARKLRGWGKSDQRLPAR